MANGNLLGKLWQMAFSSWQPWHQNNNSSSDLELPLRDDLYNADQMAQHGKSLALLHQLGGTNASDILLSRLDENKKTLINVCNLLTAELANQREITPAGAWLLDNFYLIEEQIHTAKNHLPKNYYRQLPYLKEGPSAGCPRVYDLALATIAHSDGRIDMETLARFISAYQSISPLKLGELWAIPIMLRLAIIENLRRISARVAIRTNERHLACAWAMEMTQVAEKDPKNLILAIADMARSNPPMVSAFVAELARRLQGRGTALALPLTWIEQHLTDSGLSIEHLVQLENQQQAADQVSVSNSIGSLRILGAVDWRDFVEQMSVAEQIFRQDPSQIYSNMDFATRDRYRHVLEALAKQSHRQEIEVAQTALHLAQAATGQNDGDNHIGYFLIGQGVDELEQAINIPSFYLKKWKKRIARSPLSSYLLGAALITALFSLLILQSIVSAYTSLGLVLLMGVLVALSASQSAISLVNWLVTLWVAPHTLPRMNFSEGVPQSACTLVIVPTMLMHSDDIEDLIESIEVAFLANRDKHIYFGLLTDFSDSAQQNQPEDAALQQLAQQRINQLNQKYAANTASAEGAHFYLFHRARSWNKSEKTWMGYERKRGKLSCLNALLRANSPKIDVAAYGFSQVEGELRHLGQVKYVITLDTDTQLPRDAAKKLIATMEHPLNRAVYDTNKQRVVSGYGILQPRIALNLNASNRSRYARLLGGMVGIDPYTRAVSDVYQDAFGEGSYIGKGIYDLDAFELALTKRLPDNCILSHDLLEGCYARSGLVSDVDFYEDYPVTYRADISRRYRWLRGDWQLVGWLLSTTPHLSALAGVTRTPNPLSMLSQWKLIDNLRRSLVPIALTLTFIFAWLLSPSLWLSSVVLLGVICSATLITTMHSLLKKPAEMSLSLHIRELAKALWQRLGLLVFELALLPFEAKQSISAIGITIWRMKVSHTHLLEWRSSQETQRDNQEGQAHQLGIYCSLMWAGPALALILLMTLAKFKAESLLVAWPILLLWLVSPAIAWWISLPQSPQKSVLSDDQLQFLGALSRRTWAFFERFVSADDHYLPPDNYQPYRQDTIAHRTSPTNMGLALLANLSAYDFAYLPLEGLLVRTENTLKTMSRLAQYQGHFYNWYDTQTLEILTPAYISTVDSGNLAGHLLTLKAGLLLLKDDCLISPRVFAGLSDTLSVIEQDFAPQIAPAEVKALRQTLQLVLAQSPTMLSQLRQSLLELQRGGVALVAALESKEAETEEIGAWWAQKFVQQADAALEALNFIAPWLSLRASPESLMRLNSATENLTLHELAQLTDVEASGLTGGTHTQSEWMPLQLAIHVGASRAKAMLDKAMRLALQAEQLTQMEYNFLFDPTRNLLSIGYNVTEQKVDSGCYDLLASEARLCCFVAIAQGQIPQESWFALGRLLTNSGGESVLMSWTGSMFEYLMPLLVMPSYENTLLEQTCRVAVERQITYGAQMRVAWGISESGYNAVDVHQNYQYRAFGVPGLGLKRGLAEDLVIAPYASVMALMVIPEKACLNLMRLADEKLLGQFGLFEAVDYTPIRQRRLQTSAIVYAYMAHHQGMSLLALAYLLLDKPMQRRFESDRLFQSVLLLLQERIPVSSSVYSHTEERPDISDLSLRATAPIRTFDSPDTQSPEVQLLSNGRYHVMVNNAGSGYSRWKDMAMTRWHEDSTSDRWGTFCYVRDHASGEFWSNSSQPCNKSAESFEATFTEGRAEFRRTDAINSSEARFETLTEIVVSPEDDIELRRIRITNRSKQARLIDVTSYAEVVIAPAAADALHPAFSNLFVQTEILPEQRAILCTRRPRSPTEAAPCLLHLMIVHGGEVSAASYETDRLRFIGRTHTSANPQTMQQWSELSGTQGSVLDPIVAIRYRIKLAPGQSSTLSMITGGADHREAALGLINKYQDYYSADRVFDMAWTHSHVVLRQLNANEADSQLYAQLAGAVIYAQSALRADKAELIKNRRGQSGLWGYAISGDLPIVLLQISAAENIELVQQLIQAHAYWRLKGLTVDLVIWNEDHAGYRQRLQEQILGLIASGIEASVLDRPGGIFVRSAEHISSEDRLLFQSVARVVLIDSKGTLEEQLTELGPLVLKMPKLIADKINAPPAARLNLPAKPKQSRLFDNGVGGFSQDGREYVIELKPEQVTPAPWVNILANPHFGSVISESGSAYTWSENAHEYRLTPWSNDAVSDSSGEAIYLRDEETGQVWSPTPLPCKRESDYTIRHGFGYSVFETQVAGVHSQMWVYVALDAPIKFIVLKVRNDTLQPRKLSATAYMEWVLGDLRSKSAIHIQSMIDPHCGALCARNPYSTEFSDRIAFLDCDNVNRFVTGDRTEFLGRNGSLKSPAALQRTRLSGKTGAGFDPCAAMQTHFELAAGQEKEIVFRLGLGKSEEEVNQLLSRFRGVLAAKEALLAVQAYWQKTLTTVQVHTPDQGLNLLANGWLMYQTLACRIWARSGAYQSGGAFGFRDQLQDVMALVHAEPAIVRAHLLLCASRQFKEGDVQHWWHPPLGRGVRTRCSDDYLWLALAVCRYVESSADLAVLATEIPFLDGRLLHPDEESYFDLPTPSEQHATLYQHCVLAIEHGLRFGERGLPLMGSGDWNDGMNLVGIHGKGESIWLGFFLCEVLRQFSKIATAYGDAPFALRCDEQYTKLHQNLEAHGWDGEWYRRAYFDDGTPLGSHTADECKIDSIAQSWSVLSGAYDANRSQSAMAALDTHLVCSDIGVIKLFDPPFNSGEHNPGYIRGYVPGVRENGGQYTHGAIWAAMAFAELGERDQAWKLLNIINPILHATTPAEARRYKVEPYVIAADVYALPNDQGRGGWSWYTGSAGWLYRLITESLLGIKLEGNRLTLQPCLPADWPRITIDYRYMNTVYHLGITQTPVSSVHNAGVITLSIDGVLQEEAVMRLVDDQQPHLCQFSITIDQGITKIQPPHN
ncbi:GH36-type glycosyl hydrolase domain-containing protein [Iodobacter arcticus]|uniref:GH36-type glycosyl hydrolase domain-containing protein n=1 Tax=Iodobacter arcticus TaxID=590593 RepID=A0ABW2QSX5_9NEIS